MTEVVVVSKRPVQLLKEFQTYLCQDCAQVDCTACKIHRFINVLLRRQPEMNVIKLLASDLEKVDELIDSVEIKLKDNRKYRPLADKLIQARVILSKWLEVKVNPK